MNTAAARLEALLLVAGEAISRSELKKLLQVSDAELQLLVDELTNTLSGHGLAIVQTNRDVELTTSPEVGEWLSTYAQAQGKDELTAAAAETLAVVAYLGPLTRYEVDLLRGVDSRRMLRSLRLRGMVQRQAGQGRSPQYDITEEFLKRLGVTRREDLPRYGELSRAESAQQLLGKSL